MKGMAQKLPNVQKESMFAMQTVKVDGDANEWSNTFKAYNANTSLFYTLANDKKNVYLVIKAENYNIIEKIVGGGITFTVKNVKGETKTFSITYPIIEGKARSSVLLPLRDTTVKSLALLNQDIKAITKEISLTGLNLKDSLLSIYNEYGSAAASGFNNKRSYIYELSLPLEVIKDSISDKRDFAYKVELNGINGKVKGSALQLGALMSAMADQAGSSMLEVTTPTNFSGNYILSE